MKELWCWRCRMNVPMFDEDELVEMNSIYRKCLLQSKKMRITRQDSIAVINNEAFRPLTEWHHLQTGADCTVDEMRHHRAFLFGPNCKICNKPLRSPRAKRCAECGTRVLENK